MSWRGGGGRGGGGGGRGGGGRGGFGGGRGGGRGGGGFRVSSNLIYSWIPKKEVLKAIKRHISLRPL